MKVALVSFDFGEYCIRLASALSRDAEVLLLLPESQSAPFVSRLDRAVTFRPFDKPRLRQPLAQMRAIRTILRYIREFDPDVVHFQHWHLWFDLALPLLKYPLVLTIHDPTHHVGDRGAEKTPQAIINLGYRRAAQVIVHSRAVRDQVVAQVGVPENSVHVIPHIALGDEQAKSEIKEDDHLILFFGRIWEYKGLEYLIRAEPLITEQVPNARILIAGEGDDFGRYRRMMVHPDRFIVHNDYIGEEQRAEYFRRASVVVLPYVEASQSGVIPVAYTFGKPVVATTVGGLPEMVEDGRTGYLVPPRDERQLADAIVRLVRDKELRRHMGANGKRKLDAECAPAVVARQTLAVYQRAVAGKSHPRISRIPKGLSVSRTENQITLRRFPYPYQAALAICSDIDDTQDTNEFLEIQRFLNTKQTTSMGEGVGLEIGNSFYFYDDQNHFSCFGGDERARGAIRDFISAGYVDCLHSFGDAAVRRDQVLCGLEMLAKLDRTIQVWVNHYGAPSNLSRKFEYMFGECRGDDPNSNLYHANLLLDYGVRFAWLGASTRVIGQSPARPRSYLATVFDPRHPESSALSILKEARKWALGTRGDERFILHRSNQLTRATRLEDGRQIHEFIRYCDHPNDVPQGATSRGLAHVISRRVLDRLKSVGGFTIVYTHLGKNKDCRQVIAPETQAALRHLENEYRAGKIYVTTTSKLLTYYNAFKHLRWTKRNKDGVEIEIDCLDDPVFGRTVPAIRQLEGITFYVPVRQPVRICLGESEVKGIQRNPADETGMESVTIPVTRLVYPY
ncbi:MAG: glycosyltransferase family 4 protein [Chloroflexi bacterium]|nr:glycosyltransferase family 4 protein [Chloroflexota bacterium]